MQHHTGFTRQDAKNFQAGCNVFYHMCLKKEISRPEPAGIACMAADKGLNENLDKP